MMNTLLQDLRYGARMVLKKRGLTVVAVITLGLGIGANTTMFSVINGLLLRPMPFKDPERLVHLAETAPKAGFETMGLSFTDFADWRAQPQLRTDGVVRSGFVHTGERQCDRARRAGRGRQRHG